MDKHTENDARLTDAACHDCCDGWTESGGRGHDSTCAQPAENDAPLCPGCDDPIPPRCQRFGVCHNCYGRARQPVTADAVELRGGRVVAVAIVDETRAVFGDAGTAKHTTDDPFMPRPIPPGSGDSR